MTGFKKKKISSVIVEKAKKLAENPAVTKIVLPVASIGISSGLALKKISDSKKQTEAQLENLEKLSDDIKILSKEVRRDLKENKETRKKGEKSFSIEGGGFKMRAPKSILREGIKKIAEDSKLRSTEENLTSVYEAVKSLESKGSISINKNPEDFCGINLYQLGDVLIFYISYVSSEDLYKLNKILDSYCTTFKNSDYSSSLINGRSCLIELWIAEDSMRFLLNKLVMNGYSINILL